MMARPGEITQTIRRILVCLDASPSSFRALDAAARLAAELGAALEGRYVEAGHLQRFAALPVTRVVDPLSAAPRAFDAADVEREFRRRAERARRAVGAAAGRRVTWRFRVVRGDVENEVIAAARGADLLSLGFEGEPMGLAGRAGSLARRMTREAPGSLLLLRGPKPATTTVTLCYEPGAEGERALSTAASIARAQHCALAVIVVAENAKRAGIEDDIAARLDRTGMVHAFLRPDPHQDLRGLLRATRGGVLVINAGSAFLAGDEARGLVERCNCSLLLVR